MDNLFFDINRKVTEVFSCRSGDYFIHVRCKNILTGEYTIIDMWEVKNGDCVTLTNRYEDFPIWFKLHPKEVKQWTR